VFLTADQFLAHCVGDYLLQSDWMATKKRTSIGVACVHAWVYTLCFMPFVLWRDDGMAALSVIFTTHALIDHYGLARYVVWAKNFLAPRWMVVKSPSVEYGVTFDEQHLRNLPWSDCTATGYPPDRPPFLAVWLLIVADNVLHVLINGLALRFL
jgi:hypothetical protein